MSLPLAGTVMLNPNLKDAPSIMIQYPEYVEGIAAYPDESKILKLGRSMSTVKCCWCCLAIVWINVHAESHQ